MNCKNLRVLGKEALREERDSQMNFYGVLVLRPVFYLARKKGDRAERADNLDLPSIHSVRFVRSR